jgi:hypothetical protein
MKLLIIILLCPANVNENFLSRTFNWLFKNSYISKIFLTELLQREKKNKSLFYGEQEMHSISLYSGCNDKERAIVNGGLNRG